MLPPETTQYRLYSLGGPRCNRLHFGCFSLPAHTGQPFPKGGNTPYFAKRRNHAILADAAFGGRQPTLYGMILLRKAATNALD